MARKPAARSKRQDKIKDGEQDEKLRALVSRLQREANDRVAKRQTIEERWLADLRQFHGKYDPKTLANIGKHASKVFINQTRTKTNSIAARLGDMLFPTDDKNWEIKPTPVPELVGGMQSVDAAAMERMAQQANRRLHEGDAAGGEQIAAQANAKASSADEARENVEKAKEACEAMSLEMEDQLRECDYQRLGRAVIDQAGKIGTGVIKGPIAAEKGRRNWRKAEVEDDDGPKVVWELGYRDDARPIYQEVDLWGWFPNLDVANVEASDSFFERHLYTKRELRRLAKAPGFDKDAIRDILRSKPEHSTPNYLTQLREINAIDAKAETDGHYHVWEYRGPLAEEELELLCECMGREDIKDVVYDDETDPLAEIQVVLWFCQGVPLKIGLHHLDSDEPIYSVFCHEDDPSSIFGVGVPYLMRHSQSALNGAWRMMMDNAGLSVGPQIVINQNAVEPEDGDWTLRSRKVWRRKTNSAAGDKPFEIFNIDSRQVELANIIELAMRFIDDETVSQLAEGEQGSHITQTAQGMSILQNNLNVVFRRLVKNFDDMMTVPSLRRLYDWNMQFSDKEEIKGDYEVDARGSSVLLVREIQSQSLMMMALQFRDDPLVKRVKVLRKVAQSHMIPADEIIMTDREIDEAQRKAAENPPPDPEMMKLEAQMQIATITNDTKIQIAMIERETAMIKLATEQNINLEKLRAMIMDRREERDSKERILATEVAVEMAQDERAAARGEPEKGGSGGYIS